MNLLGSQIEDNNAARRAGPSLVLHSFAFNFQKVAVAVCLESLKIKYTGLCRHGVPRTLPVQAWQTALKKAGYLVGYGRRCQEFGVQLCECLLQCLGNAAGALKLLLKHL